MFSICGNGCIQLKKIESHPERVLNIKPFINKCNWKGMNCLSTIGD